MLNRLVSAHRNPSPRRPSYVPLLSHLLIREYTIYLLFSFFFFFFFWLFIISDHGILALIAFVFFLFSNLWVWYWVGLFIWVRVPGFAFGFTNSILRVSFCAISRIR